MYKCLARSLEVCIDMWRTVVNTDKKKPLLLLTVYVHTRPIKDKMHKKQLDALGPIRLVYNDGVQYDITFDE